MKERSGRHKGLSLVGWVAIIADLLLVRSECSRIGAEIRGKGSWLVVKVVAAVPILQRNLIIDESAFLNLGRRAGSLVD